MKKMPVFIAVLLSIQAFSQQGIGTSAPNKYSILELQSTTKGFLIPRMNQASMENIFSQNSTDDDRDNAVGLQVYCITCTPVGIYVYSKVDIQHWQWKVLVMVGGILSGEIIYFDGNQWTTLPIGVTGSRLKLINSVPTWVNLDNQ